MKKMLSLAERVEKCCTDDTLRNEMYRVMVAVCAESQDEETKKKAEYYYNKLPYFIHSREMYARYVMEGETYHRQVKETLTGMVSQAEVSVRQLITPDMPPRQQLFYYEKAAGLYEILLDGTVRRYIGGIPCVGLHALCILAQGVGAVDRGGLLYGENLRCVGWAFECTGKHTNIGFALSKRISQNKTSGCLFCAANEDHAGGCPSGTLSRKNPRLPYPIRRMFQD